jgi:hypothetical protein
VQATSSDQYVLSIYAAIRQEDGALTLMIINKTQRTLESTLSLDGFSPIGDAAVYRYSASSLAAIVREADMVVDADGFSASFPAESITLVVIAGED